MKNEDASKYGALDGLKTQTLFRDEMEGTANFLRAFIDISVQEEDEKKGARKPIS